jgi:hypothetical protein
MRWRCARPTRRAWASTRSAPGAPAGPRRRLRFGLSHEFLVRADGWPALKQAYGLPFTPGSGLDHGLAYEALQRGQVDLIDVYSTDAKIGRLKLRVLRDDRGFFPRYDAVLLMRASLDETPLAAAGGRIDEATMIALNAEVETRRPQPSPTWRAASWRALRRPAPPVPARRRRSAASPAPSPGRQAFVAPVRARPRPPAAAAPGAGVRLAGAGRGGGRAAGRAGPGPCRAGRPP